MEQINMFLNVPLAMAFLIVSIVPFFYQTEVYTAYEYLERRFDNKSRSLTALLFLIMRGLATGVTLYAPALVLSVVTGLDTGMTILIMGVIAITYTVLGGISAVIWTDVIQMVILWLGALLSVWTILTTVPGGFGEIVQVGSAQGLFQSLKPLSKETLSMKINNKNAKAKQNEDGSIHFIGRNGKKVFEMP